MKKLFSVSIFSGSSIFILFSSNIKTFNSIEEHKINLFENTLINELTNKENKEGDYSSWSSKREKYLTTTNVYTYSEKIGNLDFIYKNYKLVEITFDIKIGIYGSNGSDYNFFNGTLKFNTLLSDIEGPENEILTDSGEKQPHILNVNGNQWSGYGFTGKQTGTFVFEHTTGNYAKWVFINVGAFWSDSGNLIIKHNGYYSFKNASTSKKYINTYRKVNSINFIPNY